MMKRIAALLIAPVVLAAAPAPEQARSSGLSKATLARMEIAKLARCTVTRSPKLVADVLAMPEGPESRSGVTDLASGQCLISRNLEFDEKQFRGALFIELYQRRSAKGATAVPVLAAYDPDEMIEGDAEQRRFAALLWFADCVVKRDRDAANAVVLGAIGSAAQAEAYARLQPHLSPCLVEGAQVRFNKAALEGALAEVLYRGSTGA